jgi:hypothetical protein
LDFTSIFALDFAWIFGLGLRWELRLEFAVDFAEGVERRVGTVERRRRQPVSS